MEGRSASQINPRVRKLVSSSGPVPVTTSSNVAILSNASIPLPNPASKFSASRRTGPRNVVIIFDASRELSTSALEWTLDRILQPGDALTLLGILHQVLTPSMSTSPIKMGIANLLGYKARVDQSSFSGVNQRTLEEEAAKKLKLYSPLISDIQKTLFVQAKLEVRVVAGNPLNLTAVNEAWKIQPSWIILDRNLKRQRKFISEQIACNIILMDRNNEGKILKLCGPVVLGPSLQFQDMSPESSRMLHGICTNANSRSSIRSSSGDSDSSVLLSGPSDSDPPTPKSVCNHPLHGEKKTFSSPQKVPAAESTQFSVTREDRPKSSPSDSVESMRGEEISTTFSIVGGNPGVNPVQHNFRELISQPKLCPICRNKSKDFKRQTKCFTFLELEEATENFAPKNFIAEGGYGFVYKGILQDGQHIAVKQHKLASTQGDKEFCAEVEVLSGAQHVNLVTLLGFCIEDGRRMLVYEFVCNKSLDWHLFDNRSEVLPWSARQAIAVGAARGLRYLHEECRVGTIIHRDFRPHNILLNHDYCPMVGDFGLARWHADNELTVETKVIGTFGYLSPEYASSGQVTEKADVYSFGVVLLELITGRRTIDSSLPPEQKSLTEWARPKLEVRDAEALLDPKLFPLEDTNSRYEIQAMIHAAAFCLRRDPAQRPRMSQILRILEGEKEEVSSSSSTWEQMMSSIPRQSFAAARMRDSSSNNTLMNSGTRSPILSYREMITNVGRKLN